MRKWVEMAHEKKAHIFPTYWYWESVQHVGKTIGVEPGFYASYYKNHEMSYISEETGWTRVGKVILRHLRDNKKLIEKIEEVNNMEIPVLLEYSQWFAANDLTEKSGEELLKQHNLVYDQFMKLMSYSAWGTVIEFEEPLLSNYLEGVLQNKVADKLKIGDYFNNLTSPIRLTTPQKEEIELRKLKIRQIKGELTDEEIEEHKQNYSYIAFGYDGPGWSKQEIVERLAELANDVDILEKEITELETSPEQARQKQSQAITDLNLNNEEQHLFCVLNILGYWKFERKLANQKSHELMELFFEELMRRFHLSKAQTKMIVPYEMAEVLLKEEVDENLLNERIKSGLVVGTILDMVITVPLFTKSYVAFYSSWMLYVGFAWLLLLTTYAGYEFDATYTKPKAE